MLVGRDLALEGLRVSISGAGNVNYVDGANIAGFVKVADAMLGQGLL